MKENKFTMGEDERAAVNGKAATTSPPKNTSTQQHKRPVRHHVKRRSSGKVHVAKLAPMARASSNTNVQHHSNDTDSFHDSRLAEERPVIMRRSQSQKSLHKMSFERKGFTGLTPANSNRRKSNASLDKLNLLSETSPSTPSSTNNNTRTIISATSPPTPTITKCPPAPSSSTKKLAPTQSSISLPLQYGNHRKSSTTLNPVSISNRTVAKPVEQTFNAMANNLSSAESLKLSTTPTATISSLLTSATPNSSPYRNNQTTVYTATNTVTTFNNTNSADKKYLKSQFVTPSSEPIPAVYSYSNNSDDQLLNHSVGREYDCIHRYHDPMRSSLLRCMEKLDLVDNTNNSSVRRRLQVGHSMSTSLVPTVFSTSFASSTSTSSSSDNYDSTNTANSTTFNTPPPIEPHREQKRQIANNRHQHLKAIALSNSNYRQQYQQQFKSHSYNPSSTNNIYHHHTTSNAGGGGRLLAALPRNAASILDKWFSNHGHSTSSNHH